MRGLILGPSLCLLAACGGGAAERPPPEHVPVPVIAKGDGLARDGGPTDTGALRPLAHRLPPNQSLAYRVKVRSEQPGRKVEQDFVIYLDAWNDGTQTIAHFDGERERSGRDGELEELLPLPEGAQTSYTAMSDASRDKREPAVQQRFERTAMGGNREQITWRIERKRGATDEITTAVGLFDDSAMRYERLTMSKLRTFAVPRWGEPPRENKQDFEITYDAESTAARVKERAARRKTLLEGAQEPPTPVDPVGELIAALGASAPESSTIEFHTRGRPALLWRTILARKAASDRVRGLFFDKPVPKDVLADVRAAIRKSPSHPVSWLVLGARDPRLAPELELIAKRHEEETARENATERLKDLRRTATPLATRLKNVKPGRRITDGDLSLIDVDPDRDRAALFEFVLPRLTTATEDERNVYVSAMAQLSKTSIGDDVDAWTQFWDSHKNRPYDEWLLEALATDPTVLSREQAATALGDRPPSEASRQALRAALEDKSPRVRFEAAQSLAAFHDEVAIRPLVRALFDDAQRWEALISLSHFSETDFGLNPTLPGASPQTQAALGRWIGWAKRRGIDPGLI